jgi:hypothetical protein
LSPVKAFGEGFEILVFGLVEVQESVQFLVRFLFEKLQKIVSDLIIVVFPLLLRSDQEVLHYLRHRLMTLSKTASLKSKSKDVKLLADFRILDRQLFNSASSHLIIERALSLNLFFSLEPELVVEVNVLVKSWHSHGVSL